MYERYAQGHALSNVACRSGDSPIWMEIARLREKSSPFISLEANRDFTVLQPGRLPLYIHLQFTHDTDGCWSASDIWSYKTMKLVIYLWWLRWSKLITFDKLGHWDQDIQPTSVFCEVDKSIAHLFIKYWYVHDISIQFQQSTYTFWRIDDGG